MISDEKYRQAAVDNFLGGREDDNDMLIAYPMDETDTPNIDRVNCGALVKAWLWVSDEEFEWCPGEAACPKSECRAAGCVVERRGR